MVRFVSFTKDRAATYSRMRQDTKLLFLTRGLGIGFVRHVMASVAVRDYKNERVSKEFRETHSGYL